MNRSMRWCLSGFAVALLLVLVSACPPKNACGPGACAGCCDSSGQCQLGSMPAACGANGAICAACGATQVCQAGVCSGGGAGGGGGGSGGAGGGSGYVSREDFCNSIADAVCSQTVSCKTAEATWKADCVAYAKRFFCGGPLEVSLAKGRQLYDPAAAAACLAAFQSSASTCGSISFSSSACSKVYTPTVNSGSSCSSSQSEFSYFFFGTGDCKLSTQVCAGTGCSATCQDTGGLGQQCRYGSCDTGGWCDTTANLCRAPRPAGSTCSSTYGSECDANSYCDTVAKLCVALPTTGLPCRSGSPYCASGNYCDYASTPSTCRAYLAINQSCSTSSSCSPTAFCDSSMSYTCQPRKSAGGSCTSSFQCQDPLTCKANLCTVPVGEGGSCRDYGDCQSSLSCDSILRTCEKYQSAGEGGACTGSTRSCGSGMTCRGAVQNADGGVGTPGTCQKVALGDACPWHGVCPDGAYCRSTDGGSGTCQPASLGTSCSYGDNCLAAHYCANGVCTSRLGLNAPCANTDSRECASPLKCKTGVGDGGVCGEPGGAGAPCIVGGYYQCKTPYECIGGVCTLVGVNGGRCASAGACYNGGCTGRDDAGNPGTCGPYLAVGAPCSMWLECASQRCESGQCAAACP